MIQNENFCLKIGVVPIDKKMNESHLRVEIVQRRAINAFVRQGELIQVEGTKRGRRRPTKNNINKNSKKIHVN